MIAMSSEPRRRTSSFVRLPSRAVPVCSIRVAISAQRSDELLAAEPSARARRGAGRRRAARSWCESDRRGSGRRGSSRPGSGASATLAICGRCVIVSTCARSASRFNVAATACAVSPPMPASISSKTIVSPPPTAAIASATRESSPPEAVSATGPNGRPAFGRIRKTTSSAPLGPGSRSRSSARNSPSPMPTPRSSAATAAANGSRGLRPRVA